MNKKLIGVDLGGTTIKFAILTDQGEIQQKWSLRTNILDEGSHIVPDIIESINHHIDLYKMDRSQFIGIGMGIGHIHAHPLTLQQADHLGDPGVAYVVAVFLVGDAHQQRPCAAAVTSHGPKQRPHHVRRHAVVHGAARTRDGHLDAQL